MAEQRKYLQANRTREGVTEYGWRPSTDTEWDPTEVVWNINAAVPPVGYVAWMVYEAQFGTKKGTGFGRWAVCPTCLEEFPISQMVKVRGRYYCTKYRDNEEQK